MLLVRFLLSKITTIILFKPLNNKNLCQKYLVAVLIAVKWFNCGIECHTVSILLAACQPCCTLARHLQFTNRLIDAFTSVGLKNLINN